MFKSLIKLFKTAFISQTGAISTRRILGIPVGFVYLFLESCVVLINLIFNIKIDDFVLNGIDNLGYLATALLCATIADTSNKKVNARTRKIEIKSLFLKSIITANGTVSSKKFVGLTAGINFVFLQIVFVIANVFFQLKIDDNISSHSIGIMFFTMALLGIDVAQPAISKLQNLFKKNET